MDTVITGVPKAEPMGLPPVYTSEQPVARAAWLALGC